MNKPLELVYESIYQRKPINEKFMDLSGKLLSDVYNRIKEIIHDTYGQDVMDIILNDVNLEDVKRSLYDMIKQSDLEDLIKVKLINKLGKVKHLCGLYNLISINSRAY